MIKDIYIVLFFVLLLSCDKDPEISKSQENFHLKVFGGSTNDVCNAIRSDGENLFLTGSLDYLNGPDMFLIKTDKYGNEVDWSPKLFGPAGTDVGYDISIDRNQNIIIAGHTQSAGSELSDVFVVKTNANGEELWSKRFGGGGNERAYAINTSASNTIYIAGYTESASFEIKRRQGWLLALSENGDSLWSQDYGTSFVPDELHGITAMKDSLLLMGTTQSLFGNFSQDVFLFILKKSTKGIENSVTLFKIGKETGVSAVYSPFDGIFVLGYTEVSPTVNNILLWKLTEDLRVVKEQQIVANISETPSAILYENGRLAIVGTAINEQGNEDYLTYIVDVNFNTISRNVYGASGNQRGSCGAIVGKSVVVGGSTMSGNSSKASIYKTPDILP